MRGALGFEPGKPDPALAECLDRTSDALVEQIRLRGPDADPEELEMGVELRRIREGAVVGGFRVEGPEHARHDLRGRVRMTHERTAQGCDPGELIEMMKSDAQCLHSSHRKPGKR